MGLYNVWMGMGKKIMPAIIMQVQLLTMTPDAEALIYAACKSCTSEYDAKDHFYIAKNLRDEESHEVNAEAQHTLIRHVIDSGHLSVLEHVAFSFAVSGVSRALSHQLVRHRIASYSQQSQRYVKAGDFDYVVPKSILDRALEDAPGVYYDAMRHIQAAYTLLLEAGVPAEDARFVLPNACETKVVVTMNCRSLLHFFELRCCTRAQWEIRAMADAMLGLCRERLPVIFAGAGARCERLGYCPEDEKFSCGRYPRREG